MNLIEIHFDGGCKPTNPGNKYGSFEVQLDGVVVFKAQRIALGWGTNNEAEYDILLEALKQTVNNLYVAGLEPLNYEVQMFTDAMIVARRIESRNIGKGDARMRQLAVQCLTRLKQFKRWRITWRGRQANVDRFDH